MSENKFWICFGDIHDNVSNINKIYNLNKAEGVIITGDITNIGGKERAKKVLESVAKINSNIYAQIGNMDKPDITEYLEEKGWNIHAKGIKIADDVGLMGVGYSSPTPFHTPSEAPEAVLYKWLEDSYNQIQHLPKIILSTHTPPFGTKTDRVSSGMNVGSKSVLEFIMNKKPDICITGHIHESKAHDFIGRTKVLNPGMFSAGGYIVITLKNDKLEAEIKNI